MRTTTRTILAALVAVAAVFGLSAAAASAAPVPQRNVWLVEVTPAGSQVADFYYSTSCSVSPDGKARMSVTNWDIPAGQRYHIDLNSRIGVGPDYYQNAIYINGSKLSGGTDDRYWDDSGRYDSNTFKGVWIMDTGMSVSCSRVL